MKRVANIWSIVTGLRRLRHPHRFASKSGSGGFLLIAVLLLLSLLTVLVVASVMLAQIERRAASNGESSQLAQQNALFALKTALGQLQREAGPDQRITARADILSTTPAPSASNGATAYWTGVWKTYNPNGGINQQLDVGTTPLRTWSTTTQGPRWLVSLPPNALTLAPSTSLPTPKATIGGVTVSTMTVANVGSAGTSYPVNVPLVPMITNRTLNNSTKQVQTGQYGYWVSDEGIKAKANLVDPNVGISPSTNLVDSQRQFLAPAANALFKILPNPLNTDFRANASYLPRVYTPLSLQYVTGTTTSPSGTGSWTSTIVSQNLADITTYSMGVLADVRKGGLKTDLTAAFESKANCNMLFPYNGLTAGTSTGTYDTQNVYRAYAGAQFGTTPNYGQTISVADAIATGTDTTYTNYDGYAVSTGALYDGLPWQTLYYFYNLYRTSAAAPHIPPLASTTPTGTQTNSTTNPSAYPYGGNSLNYLTSPYNTASGSVILPMTPVVLGTRLDLSVAPVLSGGLWSATLTAYPQIILWNPYSVPLNPPSGYSFIDGTLAFRENALWCWIGTGSTTGSGVNTLPGTWGSGSAGAVGPGCSAISINNNFAGRSNLYTLPETGTPIPFLPGEIRVYALSSAPSLGTLTPAPASNGGSGTGSILQFITGTGAGMDEPTSYSASTTTPSMSGDNGQSITFTIGDGVHNNQGAVINPSTDLFHVAIGTATGTGTATVPYSTGSGACYYIGGVWTRSISPTTVAWPFNNVTASRLGMGAKPFVAATPVAPSGPPNDQPVGSAGEFRVASYMIRMKGLQSPASPTSTSWVNGKYAAPMFMGNSSSFDVLSDCEYGCANYEELYGLALNANTEDSIVESPNSLNPHESGTLWGTYSAGDPNNFGTPGAGGSNASTNNVVLYDIPNQPMVSLGQFMHMPLYLFNATSTFDYLPGAAMFVGGSLACPEVPLNETANILCPPTTSTANAHYAFDNSFMANQALFDSYFFSTVPPSGGFGFSTVPAGVYTGLSSFNAAYIQSNKPLPNGRMRYYLDNGIAPTGTTVWNGSTILSLQQPYLAAANLMVDGAFNVNSTSIPAWIALLSSLSQNQIQLWNATSGSTSSYTDTTKTYIPRFWSGTSGATGGPWDGTHPLTDTQIKTLATEIVAQVKLRGPFLSMGDFLNRRLYNGTPTATTGSIGSLYTEGALQAAIDTDTSGINTNALTFGTPLTSSNVFTPFPYAVGGTYNAAHLSHSSYPLPSLTTIVGNTAVGTPAYLMQQDIVQAFAPVMTVRSDTFVVRVYGEADNPSTGSVEGRAWGEAVVQRVPDYVDQTDPALTTAPSTTSTANGGTLVPPITTAIGNATPIYDSSGKPLLNATNQTFGRRFKVVSFHWLNSNDL